MFLVKITNQGLSLIVFLSFLLTACSSVPQDTRISTPSTPSTTSPPTPSSQYEIRAKDSGKSFTYTVTTRFTVILDQNQYPKSDLKCQPKGVIGSISNIPEVQPPLYAARYGAVQPGTCTLKDGDFEVTIRVIQ